MCVVNFDCPANTNNHLVNASQVVQYLWERPGLADYVRAHRGVASHLLYASTHICVSIRLSVALLCFCFLL